MEFFRQFIQKSEVFICLVVSTINFCSDFTPKDIAVGCGASGVGNIWALMLAWKPSDPVAALYGVGE